MKRFGVVLLIILGLFVGMTFFAVLIIIAVLSVLIHFILRFFGKKTIHEHVMLPPEFIESETLESSFNVSIQLGVLPDIPGETIAYQIPPEISKNAHEVLIQTQIFPYSNEGSIECNYELSFPSKSMEPLYFSLYVSPFRDTPSHSYHTTKLWLGVPEDPSFNIKLSEIEQDHSHEKLQSEVMIVGYK